MVGTVWRLWGERALSAFKYLLAIFMMVAGVTTAIGPIAPAGGDLGWLYATRHALVLFGSVFFLSGASLLYGKIRRSRKWVGRGLMYIYLCFVFAACLNAMAWGLGVPTAWAGNLLMSVVVGLLYLRWKFKTEYVDPLHFTRDLESDDKRHGRD